MNQENTPNNQQNNKSTKKEWVKYALFAFLGLVVLALGFGLGFWVSNSTASDQIQRLETELEEKEKELDETKKVLSQFINNSVDGSLSSSHERARDANRKNDLRVAGNYLEEYYLDKGYYPTTLNVLVTDGYVSSDSLATKDPQGNVYTYNTSPQECDNQTTNCQSFVLSATLENEDDPDYGDNGTYSLKSFN